MKILFSKFLWDLAVRRSIDKIRQIIYNKSRKAKNGLAVVPTLSEKGVLLLYGYNSNNTCCIAVANYRDKKITAYAGT